MTEIDREAVTALRNDLVLWATGRKMAALEEVYSALMELDRTLQRLGL